MQETVTTEQTDINEERRRFLNKLWLFLAALGLVELIWLVIAFFKSHKAGIGVDNPDAVMVVGNIADFEPETVTAFPKGQFYLSRLKDGGFLALSRQCTHLGCTIPWIEAEKRFACPCHASAFDITGSILNSPAPRALDLFPIVIENDMVKVNTGRRIRRIHLRPEQVTYPVPVRLGKSS